MIVGQRRGDVFSSGYRHIAFAVNTDGMNNSGFAGQVAKRFWPGIAFAGVGGLGETMSYTCNGLTFHALVCHIAEPNGFRHTPTVVTQCLDSLTVPTNEIIACVKIGDGSLGRDLGADVAAILKGIGKSNKRIVVYSL